MTEFDNFLANVKVLSVIDHAGRAGNGFFQTIFDEHPEVLSVPWIHYCYSYLITEFEGIDLLDSQSVHRFWTEKSYFRYFYLELDEQEKRSIYKFGGDPNVEVDRSVIRRIFDEIILTKQKVSKKDVVYASFYAIARGLHREISSIKYLILTDSISLRMENVLSGFSGKIIDIIRDENPSAQFLHLIRDPRAGFASSNHQFVNQLGNMYGIKWGNYCKRLKRLFLNDHTMDSPFVFGFWLLYFRQTFRAIERKKDENRTRFLTVKNEDINLNFAKTMTRLCEDLNIQENDLWFKDGYIPTMLGSPWMGTGAYNSRYQANQTGPLKNDNDKVALSVIGPNRYVTERWKTRLSRREIFILDYYMQDELECYNYSMEEFDLNRNSYGDVIIRFLLPLKGEVPTARWIFEGFSNGLKEFLQRIFYCMGFGLFYLGSRLTFLFSSNCRKVLKPQSL